MAIPYGSPSTYAQYVADNTWLQTKIGQLTTLTQNQTTQISTLNGQVSTLQSKISQAQTRKDHTIISVGPWSACSNNDTQTRTVTYGSGATGVQTQSCVPPAPTITGYGPWSTCSAAGQQTRTLYWSNGTTTGESQDCTPPVTVVGGYWHYLYFNQYTCEFTYRWIEELSNETIQATNRYTTQLKSGCTPTTGSGKRTRT